MSVLYRSYILCQIYTFAPGVWAACVHRRSLLCCIVLLTSGSIHAGIIMSNLPTPLHRHSAFAHPISEVQGQTVAHSKRANPRILRRAWPPGGAARYRARLSGAGARCQCANRRWGKGREYKENSPSVKSGSAPPTAQSRPPRCPSHGTFGGHLAYINRWLRGQPGRL